MSEKGQGDESVEGAGSGVAVDGTLTTGGGGSAADQSGPPVGDTQTRGRGEWSYDDPDLGELKASDAPPPPLPEEGSAAEPDIPGGGPTDTRSGWEEPATPDEPVESQGPPQETPDERQAREAADRKRLEEARDRALTERDNRRAAEEGPQIDPPDLRQDGGTDSDGGSILDHFPPEENKPVIT